jgi:ABC-type antimicrobial peptide transport system permease subunit
VSKPARGAAGIAFGGLLTYVIASLSEVPLGFSLGWLGYALVMLGICLLACVVPARRALKVDAIAALRAE